MPSTTQRRVDHDVLFWEDSEGGDDAEVVIDLIRSGHEKTAMYWENGTPGAVQRFCAVLAEERQYP